MEGNWQQRWQPNGVRSICGLTEAKAKTDEEGFTEVKPEKTAKPTSRAPAPKTSMSDCRPVLMAKSEAFERLQEERDNVEEEQPFEFQSEESLYEEKERMQKKHAEKEKTKEILPPPQPATNGRRTKASRKSRRKVRPDADDRRRR